MKKFLEIPHNQALKGSSFVNLTQYEPTQNKTESRVTIRQTQ